MIKLTDILKETVKPPVQKMSIIGLHTANKRVKELEARGYEVGKDFIVVQDRSNKQLFRISPVDQPNKND